MPRAKLDPNRPRPQEETEPEAEYTHNFGGRPPWEPTDKERAVIERMGGIAMPHDQIAKIMGVNIHTLYAHCRHELDLGIAQVNALYLNVMYKKIMEGNEKLLMFYLGTKLGWVIPKDSQAAPEEDLGGMSDDELRAELDALSARERVASQARGLATRVQT